MSGRERQLVPEDFDATQLPDPLVDDDGEPLPLSEAATTYLRLVQYARNRDDYTSRYEIAKEYQYPRILEADRYFQDSFEGLTTCLITRSVVSPGTVDTRPTLWELNEMLNGSEIRRAVREALDYHLDAFDFEWVAVTTPERRLGAPYELIYLWINDPDDEISTSLLEPALRRHVERCPAADWENHEYSDDGTDGAIKIQHDPELASEEPEQFVSIFGATEHTPNPPTRGALHVATNLPDLVVGNYYDRETPEPQPGLIHGATLGYAVSHNWVRFSNGVPALGD